MSNPRKEKWASRVNPSLNQKRREIVAILRHAVGNLPLVRDGREEGRNNDLWSCLADGDDADTLSDGCIRIGTLNDLTAEWTGGVFDRYGDHFYVSVQHNATGHGVVLDITGWR